MPPVKTRGKYQIHEPYPLNEFPRSLIRKICKRIVHLLAVGHADLGGDTFCQMFADSISGVASNKPLGVADVAWNGCCWSVKTIKDKQPHMQKSVRLIIGRCSPIYSSGISDPMADIQATGNTVLEIYNTRVEEARSKHDIVRLLVLIRNLSALEFTLYERSLSAVPKNDYRWTKNARGNLEGHKGDRHTFTWQPHGSQLTILESVPSSATRFALKKRPPTIQMQRVLDLSRFRYDWIKFL